MFIKKCELPRHIRQLDAICARFSGPPEKKAELIQRLKQYEAGYRGEKSVAYQLSLLSNKEFMILHNIRLGYDQHFFEIDFLVLAGGFILLIEAKHIAGVLHFDSKINQMIRSIGEEQQRLPDPITQAERHHSQILKWMQLKKWMPVPIEKLVVISSPKSIVDAGAADEKFFRITCLIERLPHKIAGLIKQHPRQLYSNAQIRVMARKLARAHQPLIRNALDTYKIKPEQITKGVQCDSCKSFGMQRKSGKWACPFCNHHAKMAHVQALEHYALIYGRKITNQKCREFLKLESSSVSRKLMQEMKLSSNGANKGKIYYLPM